MLAQNSCSNSLGTERFNHSDLLPVGNKKKPAHTIGVSCFFLQVFRPRTPPEAIALCSRLLEYTPTARLTPLEACAHSFFDELRDPNVKLPNGREKPALFNFTTQGSLRMWWGPLLGRSTVLFCTNAISSIAKPRGRAKNEADGHTAISCYKWMVLREGNGRQKGRGFFTH